MATLTYGSTNFGDTLGGLPQISRSITRSLDPNNGTITGEQHFIRLEWHAVPTANQDIDLNQDDLAEFEALIVALADDLPLVFDRNDGEAYWAYDSLALPIDLNNYVSYTGVKITKKDFPWGPAKAVTNAPVVVEMTINVQPCLNEPVNGVGSLLCTASEVWDLAGLTSVSFSGKLCACEGEDVEDVFQDLLDSYFTQEAIRRYTEANVPVSNGFRPSSVSVTLLDKDNRCLSFNIGYDISGGGTSPSLVSDSLEVNAVVSIEQNMVTLSITGSYTYRGGFTGSAAGTHWPTLGSGPFAGGQFGLGAGKTGGGGIPTFNQVWKEAFEFQGIDPRQFLPSGSGSIFMTTKPELSVNTATNVVTSKKVFYANWIHDATILLLNETVSIAQSFPGLSQRRMMLVPGEPYPLAYVQESGQDVWVVTFTTEIAHESEYFEMPDRLTPDPMNIWRTGPDTITQTRELPNQTPPGMGTAASSKEGYAVSNIVQTYWVRDLIGAGLGDIHLAGVADLSVMTGGAGGPRPIPSASSLFPVK